MKNLKKAFLATACAASISLGVSSAQAADAEPVVDDSLNFYVSAFGGVAFADSYRVTTVPVGASPFRTRFKTGFILGGAIGVEDVLVENLRTELEVSYFRFKIKSFINGLGTAAIAPSGHLSSVNILANAWYDVDLGMAISPYVGGGAGIGIVSNRVATASVPGGAFYTGSDVGFAFQLGTGFRYDVSESIALDVGYRFRGVLGTKPKTGAGLAAGGLAMNKGDDIFVHSVQAGLSFRF